MVSRRNFLTIIFIMVIVFFLFQIPEVAKDRWNRYDVNQYEEQTKADLNEKSVYRADSSEEEANGRYIVYIGLQDDEGVGNVVSQWCFYTKRYLEVYHSVALYQPDKTKMPEALLIDTHYFDINADLDKLSEFVDMGINLVFCNLPSSDVVNRSYKLKKILGIRSVISKNIKAEGIRLMEGFLLGGQKEYKLEEGEEVTHQDFDLNMPWYWVSSGTRTYMAARMEEENDGLKNEKLPAVIWRNSVDGVQVFAVNGDFLSDNSGIGILEAMMSEFKEYDIYPVINAKNLVIANYPMLASENEEIMMEKYSQSLKAFYRDVVWPGLIPVMQRNTMKATCMATPQMDYQDEEEPEEDSLVYYLKLLHEQEAEMGASGSYKEGVDLPQKLLLDTEFYHNVIENYTILSFYQGNLTENELKQVLAADFYSDVKTICTDFKEHGDLISYLDSDVTMQSGTNDAYSHTFMEDFRLNSVATALGYSCIIMDANRIACPDGEEDAWENLSEKFASYIDTYWKVCSRFDGTTLSESDARIRRFLALNYSQKREDDRICLSISNFDEEAWFILRTHGEEIAKAEGASFQKLEQDVYLIDANKSDVVLKMEKTARSYYY